MRKPTLGTLATPLKTFSIFFWMLASICPADILTGLMGQWSFENNALDTSGSNNHGTPVGGPTYAAGTNGNALVNGTGKYLDVGTGAGLSISNQITVAGWVYCNGPYVVGGRHAVISRYSVNGWIMDLIESTGQLRFWVDSTTCITTPGIPTNTWIHVAGVYNGVNINIYTNGLVAQSPTAKTGNITTAGNLQIAAYASANNFIGKIDELYMYRRALSASDIAELCAATVAPIPPLTNIFLYGMVTTLRGSPLAGVLAWQSNSYNAGGAYSLGDGSFTLAMPQYTNITITLKAPAGLQIPLSLTNIISPGTNIYMKFTTSATGDATTFRSSSMYSPSSGDLRVEVLRTTDTTERVILNLVSATGSTKWRLYDSSVTGKANVLSMPGSALNRIVTTGTYILEMKIVPLSGYEDDPRNTVVRKMLIVGR